MEDHPPLPLGEGRGEGLGVISVVRRIVPVLPEANVKRQIPGKLCFIHVFTHLAKKSYVNGDLFKSLSLSDLRQSCWT